MDWVKKEFNIQNIETATDKAVLIKMPHRSAYDGFLFWHPAKLVRQASHGNGFYHTFSYNESFEFRLVKYGHGKYNSREIIDSRTVSAEEMNSVDFV